MFETVVPEAINKKKRRVFYEILPISIALHAIVIGAAILGAIWNVVFPAYSPKLIRPYSLVSIPEPPPPPPPPPPPQAPAPKIAAAPPPPLPVKILEMAPTVIPDIIPQVETAPPPPAIPIPPPPVIAAPAAASPGGETGGQIGGQIGGVKHGTPGGLVFAEDGKVHIDRKEKLPLKVVDQPFPHYPDAARKLRLEDTVVVRYTIGKNGRVIDLQIIEHAKDPMFDEETLNTIKQWRFRPLTINGQAAEVVHEVEINYQFFLR